MRNLILMSTMLVLFGCKEEMETYQLEVRVESAVSGFSFEGYEVSLYNGNPPTTAVLNADGVAYIEFETLEGEDHLVEFQTNQKNFNPQGVGATEWTDVWDQQKQRERITAGQDVSVDLLVIPSTRIDVDFVNDIVEEGDSLFLKLEHEIFSNDIIIANDRSRYNLSYSAPIGKYSYEGTVYTLNDTTPISGAFTVPHQAHFSHEIRY